MYQPLIQDSLEPHVNFSPDTFRCHAASGICSHRLFAPYGANDTKDGTVFLIEQGTYFEKALARIRANGDWVLTVQTAQMSIPAHDRDFWIAMDFLIYQVRIRRILFAAVLPRLPRLTRIRPWGAIDGLAGRIVDVGDLVRTSYRVFARKLALHKELERTLSPQVFRTLSLNQMTLRI